MGLSPKICSSSPYAVPNSNPDPENFAILACWKTNDYILLKVEYPDCKNFEGIKLLLYKIKVHSIEEFISLMNGKLDPHFSKNYLSPIARFSPSVDGQAFCDKFMGIMGIMDDVMELLF